MGRTIRLTERDLSRIVRQVIRENKTQGHDGLYYLALELVPNGWIKTYNARTTLGPNGLFNALSKGDPDYNGASIFFSVNDMLIDLVVKVGGDIKVDEQYPITPPDDSVDYKKILKDLGKYKDFKFAKTPYMG